MNIIFCLPGLKFSKWWIQSWMETVSYLSNKNIQWSYNIDYTPVVYHTRNKILFGDPVKGTGQKPFDGGIKYDYQFWIDDDIVWQPEDILTLIEADKDIISGCYPMGNTITLPIAEYGDEVTYSSGKGFDLMTMEDVRKRTEPFTVSFAGFGFMAIKYGVLESMEFPWFKPRKIQNGNFIDFAGEDVSFCWDAKQLGFDTWVHPGVKVGHQKDVIIRI